MAGEAPAQEPTAPVDIPQVDVPAGQSADDSPSDSPAGGNMGTSLPSDDPDKDESDPNKLHASFRRAKSRAARACEICHARKVRCDVTVHMPCTNCAAFGCECRIPDIRMKKSARVTNKRSRRSSGAEAIEAQKAKSKVSAVSALPSELKNTDMSHATTGPVAAIAKKENWRQYLDTHVRQPGRMSFLGSTSHLNLVLDNIPDSEAYYFAAVGEGAIGSGRIQQLEREDIEILKIKGAFLLPAQELSDDLIESYFDRIHPLIPVVNRTQFMRQYNDPANPPSLLLRQAIMVAGSKVCRSPALLDEYGSSKLATATFYKRAKALFESNYETDRIAIIQSALLMGWYQAGPDDVTDNVFFWTRVALAIAQGVGLHRSVERSTNVSDVEKRMWKRIWWTLFCRDRSTAVAMGRPVMINLEDSDVAMITVEDFNEDEDEKTSPYPVNTEHALFFIAQVKLSEIMGLTIREQYSIGAEHSRRLNKVPDVSQCDMAMATWMNNLPSELKYSLKDKRNHDFFRAILHAQYYTVLCLVHRSNILHRRGGSNSKIPSYPSWGIAFQAAHMIVRIVENLKEFNELMYAPAFMVYTVFSAMIILVYQTESPSKSVVESAERGVVACKGFLEIMGKVWDTADQIAKIASFLSADTRIRDKIVRSAKRLAVSGSENDTGVSSPAADANVPSGGTATPKLPAKRPFTEEGLDPHRVLAGASPNISYVRGGSSNPHLSSQEVEPSHPGLTLSSNTDSGASTSNGANFTPQPMNGLPSNGVDLASELFLVTNTSPNAVNFFENFQPSQLFPESVRSGSMQHSSPEMPSDRSTNGVHDTLFANHESFGDVFYENNYNSPTEETVAAPNTLNLGDWYKFLVSNTAPGHFPDLQNFPIKQEGGR